MTVITQIEGVLNSRPLSPLSSDPSDFEPLTPAHLLIGRKYTTVPDPDVSLIPMNRLSLYQRLQLIVQSFWRRWSNEYISELQARTKWKTNQNNLLQLGALVLIREDKVPSSSWKLGRIADMHPLVDKVIRVITIQCGQN